MPNIFKIGLCLAPLSILAACTSANTSGSTTTTCDQLSATSATPNPAFGGTVFTIVMENKSRDQILGNVAEAPYINQLANQHAVARGYHDTFVHPSEANYLWMASGENFGVLDDNDPISHHIDTTSHIADQVENAGMDWKAYQEGMGAPCGLKSHGRYAAKHNPFVYFNDVNGWDGTAFHPEERCNAHVVDYSALAADIANQQLPRYAFITPNLDHDMHDGTIAEGDAWLSTEIPKIMATDAYKNGGVIFLLWDEGGGSPAADDPPFLVISPNAKPSFVSDTDYDTTAYVKSVQAMLGVEPLPCDAAARATAATMDDLFTTTLTMPSTSAP